MKAFILLIFLSSFSQVNFAQEQDSLKSKKPALIQGTVGLRAFWMSTSYWEEFKDDHALGQSAFIQLKTKDYKGFSLLGRYTVFGNITSSDLTGRDPVTGNFNRYEVGLFDVNDPSDKFFGKLEELQLRYNSKKFSAVLGRMSINMPFINPQDGRLSPTFVEGFSLNYRPDSKNQFSADLISKISPRSTSGWYSVGESIGVYPEGQSVLGKPSGYTGNTQSDFVTVLDWKHKMTKDMTIQVNHTFVDNISSTLFSQVNTDWELSGNSTKLLTGLQFILQHGLGDGGNPDILKQYKNPDDVNYVFSGRIGLKNPKMIWWANYTRIDGKGRFLSPREWGRDPFFTFIPRERNEGYNQVDALTTYYQRNLLKYGIQVYGYAGLHFLPEPSRVEINKYGFPSYAQLNFGGKYAPSDWGKGLDFHLILMSKINMLSGELKPQWIYNKVNMVHINFIVNYTIQWK
ncbi:hypothetical protein MMU07_12195 [Aquiflexum sp. LQ15W]|uniref:hypothetical protein n=1 Tax=Cognataquiflexum nitidum TaxID=2922272 RepID=UPI001F13DE5F|nr:hypothetical protein [Cognataquiflexum nitidum]MCH6200343.1 hypothetical protein [Cognataquiflexum nitidum]